MAITWSNPKGEREDTRIQCVGDLVDEMLGRYVEWREYAAAVAEAYERWRDAPADERAWRFSAAMAALEQEELAAIRYGAAVTDVQRVLPTPVLRII